VENQKSRDDVSSTSVDLSCANVAGLAFAYYNVETGTRGTKMRVAPSAGEADEMTFVVRFRRRRRRLLLRFNASTAASTCQLTRLHAFFLATQELTLQDRATHMTEGKEVR
jgi:hypothetical protein